MALGVGKMLKSEAGTEQLAADLVEEQKVLEDIIKTLRRIVSGNLTEIARDAENGAALASRGIAIVSKERGEEEMELRTADSVFSRARQATLRDAAVRALVPMGAINTFLEKLLHEDVILLHVFEQLFVIITLIRSEVANRKAGKGEYSDENMAVQVNHARKLAKIGEAVVLRDEKSIAENFKWIKRYFVARMHVLYPMHNL